MHFRSFLAACALAAAASLAAAQSTPPAQQQTPAGGVAPGAPPLQLQNLPPDEHTLTPQEQAQQEAQQQQQRAYQAAVRLASLEARWGPAMSTTGVSISLVETGRAKAADGATQITYQISGFGFRQGESLALVRWPLGDTVQTVMNGLALNAQGRAVCAPPSAVPPPASSSSSAPSATTPSSSTTGAAATPSSTPTVPGCLSTMQPNQPVEIQTTAALAEPIRVALVASDRSNGAAAQIIPFPIVNQDQGCSLQLILGLKDADLDLLEARGFPPNSQLKFDVTSGVDVHSLNAKTNEQGTATVAFTPAVHGVTSGQTVLRFAGVVHPPTVAGSAAAARPPTPDPTCAPAITFNWGQGSYKPQ